MKSKEQFHIFLVICVMFFSVQFTVDLIKLNYYLCHFIFGFGAPYLCGYAPYKIFKWHGPKKLPINWGYKWDWSWSLWTALIIVFFASFINEVIDDPVQNKVPFLDAWQHFALDLLGMSSFLLFYYLFFRKSARNT